MGTSHNAISLAAGICLCAATSIAGSLGDNLIAYWSFDDGTGTVATDSTHNADGTLQGGVKWVSPPDAVFGTALRFDGVSGSVELPSGGALANPNSSAITISMWCKNDEVPSAMAGGIYRSYFNSNTGQDCYILFNSKNDNQLRFKVTAASGAGSRVWIPGSDLPPVNTWFHVAAVYDGTHAYIYLNGKRFNTSSATNDKATGPLKNGQRSAIGAKGVNKQEFAKGAMDDVAVWTRALSDSEIAHIYGANKPIKELLAVPDKPILYFFYSAADAPSRRFYDEVVRKPSNFDAVNRFKFVPIEMGADQARVARMKVLGSPTLVIEGISGNETGRITGLVPEADYLTFLARNVGSR